MCGGLTAFRAGDHRQWLSFFVGGAYRACRLAGSLAEQVAALQAEWLARAALPRRDSAAARLIERLPERPILALADAAELTGGSREAARKAINRLAAAGVLREITGGRRSRRWESVGLFALLDRVEDVSDPPAGRAPRARSL